MKNPNSKTTGRRTGAGILTFAILIGTAITAFGQTNYYWDSNGTTLGFGSVGGTWGTTSYWNTDPIGGAGGSFTNTTTGVDIANFGTATENYGFASIGVAAAGVNIGRIIFGAGQTTAITTLGASGNTITINNGIIKNNSANVTITSPTTLGAAQSWTNNNSSGELIIRGAVNTAGNTLTFDGIGITNFGNATTGVISGAGGVTVSAGRVHLGLANAPVHTYSGATTLNGGVTMFNNNLSANSNLVMNGGILESYWTTAFSRAQGTGAGQIQVIGGESGFSMNALGSVTFDIGSATWGSATFNPSKFILQSAFSQSTSLVTFLSSINLNGSTRTILVNNGSAGDARAVISGQISNGAGTAGLIKEGLGILTLSNASNAWNGATSVQGGYLDLTSMTNANLGGGSGRNVTVAAGCGIRFDAISNTFLNRIVETTDEITVMTGTSNNDLNFSNTGANLPNAFLGTWSSDGAKAEYSGIITPASDAYRLGASRYKKGTLGILNASTMTGTQGLIVDGYVELVGPKTFSGNTVLRSGSRLGLAAVSGESGVANCLQNSILDVGAAGGTIWLEATGSGSMTGAAPTTSAVFGGLQGSRDLSTVVTSATGGNGTYFTASSSITGFTLNPGAGKSCAYSGVIAEFATGTTITKSGAGTQEFTAANTYTGATTCAAGILSLGNSLALQNSPLNTTGSVTGNADNGLRTTVTTLTLGGITGNKNLADIFTTSSGGYGNLTALTLNTPSAAAPSYSGAIAEGAAGMTLTKSGAGTQTLSGANTYTGATNITAGALLVNSPGSLAVGSAVTVASGATLGGNGTINGTVANNGTLTSSGTFNETVTSSTGAIISPAGAGADGTITVTKNTADAMTLNGNGLNFDVLTSSGSSRDQIAITGNLVLNGVNTLYLNAPSGLSTGTYTLMTYAARTGSGSIVFPNGSNTMTIGGATLTINVDGASVSLQVGGSSINSCVWSNAAGTYVWGGGALNWTRNGTTSQAFVTGDAVTFDDSGPAASTITNTGTVSPGSVLFNNSSKNYTVSAVIGGTGTTLAKIGSGTLTLSGANTYTGGTSLNAGTLRINNASALGTGTFNINGGAIDNTSASAITISTNNAQNWNSDFIFAGTAQDLNLGAGAVTMNNNRQVTVNGASRTLTVGGAISGPGYSLTKSGAGTLYLSGSNAFNGGLVMNAGTLRVSSDSSLNNNPLTVNANSILLADVNNISSSGGITLGNGAMLDIRNNGKTFSTSGNVTGNGGIILGQAGSGSDTVNFNSVNNSFTGGVDFTLTQAGTLKVNSFADSGASGSGNIRFGLGGGTAFQIFDLGSGATGPLTISNRQFELTGSTTYAPAITNNSAQALTINSDLLASGTGTRTLYLGGTGDGVFAGKIANGNLTTLNLNKLGSGKWTLSSANTYNGTTTISAGTLSLTGGDNRLATTGTVNFPGNGTLGISNNQTLASVTVANDCTGTVADGGNLTVNGASFSIGGSGDNRTQTLTMSGLNSFVYNNAGGAFSVGGTSTGNGSLVGTVTLPDIATITANAFGVGNTALNFGTGANIGTLNLGANTIINANTIQLGNNNAKGAIQYASAKTNPILTLHGIDGNSPATSMIIGTNGGINSATYASLVDLETNATAGTFDAKVATLTIGQFNRASLTSNAPVTTGELKMGAGTLEATTIILGKNTAGGSGAAGTSTTGTLSVTGGTVKTGALYLGDQNATTATNAVTGIFNLNGGATLYAGVIDKGTGAGTQTVTRTFNWNDGTIRNYDSNTDLIINSFGGATPTFALLGASPHNFDIDSGRQGTVNQVMSDVGGLTKIGSGTLVLNAANTYTGATTVNAGKLFINGAQTAATGAVSVASGASLGGTGTIGGNVSVADGGKLEFNISTAPGSHDKLDLNTGKSLAFFGASTLTITSSGGGTTGTYTLVTAPGGISGSAPATVNLPLGWVGSVAINGNNLELTVTSTNTSYTVTYDGNGSTGGSAPVDGSSPYLASSTVTVLGNTGSLVRTGYTFNNWNTAANGSGTPYAPGATFTLKANTTLYAQWTANSYTVTFDKNAVDATNPDPASKQVTYGSTYGTLATTSRTGYTFNGWFTAPSGGTQITSGTTVTTASNHTLYAHWQIIQYTVTFATDGTPRASISGVNPQTVNYGSDCTAVTAVPGAGYHFIGWTGSITSADNPITVTNVQSNMSLTANFAPTQKWDFNGDGMSDVLASDTNGDGIIYLMNGATPDQSGIAYKMTNANWKVAGLQDFNGDGKCDMLWQHATTGKAIIYIMNGFSVSSHVTIYNGGTNWWINKFGDFNGDGKTDIIWKHSTGSYALWLMNGSAAIGTTTFSSTTWTVVGTGDFNYDGKSDILWESANRLGAIYLMNGTAILNQGIVYTKSDSNWMVTNLLDYNNDGRCDMLWKNTATSSGAIYLMKGLAIENSGIIYSNVTKWQVIQSGDFNADGCGDLLWQNATGKALIWLMVGLNRTAHGSPYTATGNWVVKQLLDFNNDKKADILLQDTATKQAFDHLIDGTNPPIGTGTVFPAGTKTVVVPLVGN